MMLACKEGRRGQPWRRWMDAIHEITGMKQRELRDMMTEWKQLRRLALMLARVQGTDRTR